MSEIKLDVKTREVTGNLKLVNLLNANSSRITNNVGKDYTTWHFDESDAAMSVINGLNTSIPHRLWADGNMIIAVGEWEDSKMVMFPKIVKKQVFASGSYEEKWAALNRSVNEMGKPENAVEFRIVCHIERFGDREILDLNHEGAKALIKRCNNFTIIPLWSDYSLRYGYWVKRYYSDTLKNTPATQEEYSHWIDGLEEPMKTRFKEDGLEECRGVLNFQRFVAEWRGVGLDEYLKRHMSGEDWKQYKSKSR